MIIALDSHQSHQSGFKVFFFFFFNAFLFTQKELVHCV